MTGDAMIAAVKGSRAKPRSRTFGDASGDAPFEPVWGDTYPWPTLDDAALYGLAGEIVNAVSPNSEAHPAALLLTLLAAFGNAAGPSAYAPVGDDKHPARLFVALVGPTSSGGKGTSWAAIRRFLRAADCDWLDSALVSGFQSGEAFVGRLSGAHNPEGGPCEKRALVYEPEFARLLAVNARDGSTSSPVIRGAWDDGRLQVVRSKESRMATDTHVSFISHVTPEELRAKLPSTEAASGFANRFLFACVRRTKKLPLGESVDPAVVEPLGARLRAAIDAARSGAIVRLSREAEPDWIAIDLADKDRDGMVGAMTARARPQRLRLALTFALLDCAAEIGSQHVVAADAVWRFCAASVEHLFGGLRGDSIQDRLLEALRTQYPRGLDGTAIRDLFAKNRSHTEISAAKTALEERRLIRTVRDDETGGRPRLVSFAVTLNDQNDQRRPKGAEAGVTSFQSFRS
jgi:hypothetical protein